MATTVQARLDAETQAALDRLVRRRGWSTSQVIRASIRLMDNHRPEKKRHRPKLVGIGMFSGPGDLSTNPRYMEDFGLDREQIRRKYRERAGKR